MAHISSMGAGIYTYLDIYTGAVADMAEATLETAFGTTATAGTDLFRMPSVREFPSIGTPANIVNVPVFGQAISAQVQGQSDAPTLEVTVNYNAADMEDIQTLVDAGTDCVFRFMMAAGPVTEAEGNSATLATANTEFYFKGKVEAILVNPALTDATTATVTLSARTDFVGPFTLDAS